MASCSVPPKFCPFVFWRWLSKSRSPTEITAPQMQCGFCLQLGQAGRIGLFPAGDYYLLHTLLDFRIVFERYVSARGEQFLSDEIADSQRYQLVVQLISFGFVEHSGNQQRFRRALRVNSSREKTEKQDSQNRCAFRSESVTVHDTASCYPVVFRSVSRMWDGTRQGGWTRLGESAPIACLKAIYAYTETGWFSSEFISTYSRGVPPVESWGGSWGRIKITLC